MCRRAATDEAVSLPKTPRDLIICLQRAQAAMDRQVGCSEFQKLSEEDQIIMLLEPSRESVLHANRVLDMFYQRSTKQK